MNIFLDEHSSRESLFPFTLTRHVCDIRIGILTIREKWEKLTGLSVITAEADKTAQSISINAAIIPTEASYELILQSSIDQMPLLESDAIKTLYYPWHIFQYNDWALRSDFELITAGRTSGPIPPTNRATQPEHIFIEEGALVEHSILNASTGPIYIGKNAQVMEGSLIRGPFSLGNHAVLKMGTKIYGATSLGPNCVGGGEIKNSVLFANSNKAHDGYLGDSVLGEWCNLGAGTSNSNVKNTGGNVKYISNKDISGISVGNKAGLLMGDYSRSAINTSFNTGTTIGVCCNLFGEMPEKFVNNFSWGKERYIFEKAISDISNWKQMKGQQITAAEIATLQAIYNQQS